MSGYYLWTATIRPRPVGILQSSLLKQLLPIFSTLMKYTLTILFSINRIDTEVSTGLPVMEVFVQIMIVVLLDIYILETSFIQHSLYLVKTLTKMLLTQYWNKNLKTNTNTLITDFCQVIFPTLPILSSWRNNSKTKNVF